MTKLFSLSERCIDSRVAREALCLDNSGAYVCFEGWVRNYHQGKAVTALNYSAYEDMAEKQGALIVAQALERFAINKAACIHRIGELDIGEIAVWIGVSAGHRQAAFDACRYIIDTIKTDVPIWKHEHYRDGSSEWTQNT